MERTLGPESPAASREKDRAAEPVMREREQVEEARGQELLAPVAARAERGPGRVVPVQDMATAAPVAEVDPQVGAEWELATAPVADEDRGVAPELAQAVGRAMVHFRGSR